MDNNDLKIDVYRAHGQGVNETGRAVRVTHIPTGKKVVEDSSPYYQKNVVTAIKKLESLVNETTCTIKLPSI